MKIDKLDKKKSSNILSRGTLQNRELTRNIRSIRGIEPRQGLGEEGVAVGIYIIRHHQ